MWWEFFLNPCLQKGDDVFLEGAFGKGCLQFDLLVEVVADGDVDVDHFLLVFFVIMFVVIVL